MAEKAHEQKFEYAEKAQVRIGGKLVNMRKREELMDNDELNKHERKVSREKKKAMATSLKKTVNTVNQVDANGNKMTTAV